MDADTRFRRLLEARDDEDSWREWYRLTPLERWHEILGIEDLIRAKKTQCDKDWPMIRRLVDAHYDAFQDQATDARIRFWLRESRTPETLIAVAAAHPPIAAEIHRHRPLLAEALASNEEALRQQLQQEEIAEKQADQAYWLPLKRELESLRQDKRGKSR